MSKELEFLFSTSAIRERCTKLFDYVKKGDSKYFVWNDSKLPEVGDFVLDVIKDQYPTLDIPYHGRWRHINAGNEDRVKNVVDSLSELSREEVGQRLFGMTIVSVLLDAGAGMTWKFKDHNDKTYSKSEGLAVAAFNMFSSGAFSSDPQDPLRVDGAALRELTASQLEKGFQVSENNPLVGVEGRTSLLNTLGKVLKNQGDSLSQTFDRVCEFAKEGKIPGEAILQEVLSTLGPIWPSRLVLDGVNLGDVWKHSALASEDIAPKFIPFHKLSQWLTYSLLEVFEFAGYEVINLEKLTGLPEYRNGGLLIDFGILTFKDPKFLEQSYQVDDEFIIEWRACTVCFLDIMGEIIREKLSMDQNSLPLAKVLEGGTWAAGRRIAKTKRKDGGSPVKIISDGTVF